MLLVLLSSSDRMEPVPEAGKIRRGRNIFVPITGFANSVAAPAIEYKKEGQVFGIGCKIFYDCRTGHPVRNFLELGAWSNILGITDLYDLIILMPWSKGVLPLTDAQ